MESSRSGRRSAPASDCAAFPGRETEIQTFHILVERMKTGRGAGKQGVSPNRWRTRVVLPDWRGPVKITAGNWWAAFDGVFDGVRAW